jgi:UDP-N-acetylglucosamine--N-acetylmuramyl-(pentapeptide) pyrophosphoryl-undecaprenol N-acetylglucosamine transferase
MVGIPVSREHVPVNTKLQQQYRNEIGLGSYKKVLFVTGGGNGADQLNQIVAKSSPTLLEQYTDLAIVVLSGRLHEERLNSLYDELLDKEDRKRVIIKGFVTDLYRYSSAADVIVARGGATGLAEFAIERKACIVIPSKQLSWQIHHARTLAARHAIIDLPENEAVQPGRLADEVADLFEHPERRKQLADALGDLARPDAAKTLAMLLLDKMQNA